MIVHTLRTAAGRGYLRRAGLESHRAAYRRILPPLAQEDAEDDHLGRDTLQVRSGKAKASHKLSSGDVP